MPSAPALTTGTSRLFLLDGMALAYRAHFALLRSPLSTSKGMPTGAVFGFLLTLKKILEQEKPDRLVVVFDASEPTFRHKEYAEYKATREKMPEELGPQLEHIRRLVEAQGIPFLRVPGFEADDVIGTLALRESERGHDVWIVSGDKDMTQLVSPRVRLYNVQRPQQGEIELVDEEGVKVRFGVPPSRVIDVLGLMGDASDNVPGVPGVGEKTAIRLIQEHGTLEDVLANAGSVAQKKLAERLVEHAELARLSKRLVTIRTDVPLDATFESLVRREVDFAALRECYRELEFQDLLAELGSKGLSGAGGAGGGDAGLTRYRVVDTPEDLAVLVRSLEATRSTGGFALDTETTSIDPMRAEVVGLSFSWKPGEAWYVPLNRDPPIFGGEAERARGEGLLFASGPTSDDTRAVLEKLRPVLEDPTIPKTGQNAKYDVLVLAHQRSGGEPVGVEVRGVDFDTMIASFCVRPDARTHNLDALSLDRLGIRKIPTSDLLGTGKSQMTMREVAIEKVTTYACEDADCTWRLRGVLEPLLAEFGVDRVFRDVEMPLLPVLSRMERTGIRVDQKALAALGAAFEARANALEEEIHRVAGETLNLRSNPKIGEFLFDRLRIHEMSGRKRPRRTEKGTGYATDERTLMEFADFHPIPRLLLEWRGLTKLKSTYVDSLPGYVNPNTGRIHTTFHQTGAATGRLSSSDPNLQNIPVRGDDGRSIRATFVAERGWRLLSADYSQVELRLLAHLAADPGLLAAFRAGEDVHRTTAAKVFGVAAEEVTPAMRARAKTINFGIVYGMGPQALAQQTSVSIKEAEEFIEAYFRIYPEVRAFEEGVVREARRTGQVTTLMGRRRPLPEISSDDPRMRSQAERIAVNTPIQGTAADLIKIAMIRIDHRLAVEKFRSRMLLQVHDELVFEVPPGEEERLTAMVRHEMSTAIDLSVPIVVDVGMGENWADAH